MSFSMTTEAVRNKTKTVTRRFGWSELKPGDLLQPVEKAMGLKQGEKIVKIGGLIRVVSNRSEPLHHITKADCVREGFPNFEPKDFIEMLREHYGCKVYSICNRIEFEYL